MNDQTKLKTLEKEYEKLEKELNTLWLRIWDLRLKIQKDEKSKKSKSSL